MPLWFKIETRVRTHPKIVQAGPGASWVWLCGVSYSREHLTDGYIGNDALHWLVPGLSAKQVKKFAEILVKFKLWHDAEGGYRIHDFHDWNPTRQEVDANKEWDRRRKELYADKGLVKSIRRRDGDHCRYCHTEVNWSDRRGDKGGQFDHVIPRGDNSLDNVVVACRKCNLSKSNRTPEEAGMPLLEPFQTKSRTSSKPDSDLVPLEETKTETKEESEKKDHSAAKNAAGPDHPIKALLTYRDELFAKVNHGAKPPKPTKADLRAAKNQIAEHGYPRARLIVRQAFVTKDRFIAESGRSMAFIASSTAQNKLIAELAQSQRLAELPQKPNSLREIEEMEAKRHAS